MHQGFGPCVIIDASPQSAKICSVLDGRQSRVRRFQLKDALAKESLPLLCSYADKSRSKSKIVPGLQFVNDDNKPADCLLEHQSVQCNVQYNASSEELYVLPQCYKMGPQRLDESSLSRVRAVRDKANEDVTSTCSSDSESTTEEMAIPAVASSSTSSSTPNCNKFAKKQPYYSLANNGDEITFTDKNMHPATGSVPEQYLVCYPTFNVRSNALWKLPGSYTLGRQRLSEESLKRLDEIWYKCDRECLTMELKRYCERVIKMQEEASNTASRWCIVL
ncbi:hypothetical protein LTR70_008078 [Exophiala xenobiotica]|uniref:Uncharacterized protein n=1 Tax=Lithohypha guttulata TaxID=1690604 RepID=A0ABR0K3P2_9EURO|nr:hypothetical protein LTR24_007195 [Lithohypha guttulata]KAK5312635.1 hypothetical protein LTR70_008078 [Exophiala xenobiotica]